MAEKPQARIPAGMATPIPPFVHQSLAMGLPVVPKKDDIDEMAEAVSKTAKLKMIRDVLNPQAPAQPAEKLDYSQFFKAMGDVNNTLATQLTNMYAQNANAAQNSPAIMEVKHQVEKLSDKLENAGKGNQTSDMEIFFNGMARMEAMGNVLRKSLGIPDGIKTTGSDLPQLLGMEEIRIRDARAAREHEEKMLLLRHQLDMDSLNSDRDYKLKVVEFADKRKRSEKTGAMFEDLLGSVMEGIDLSPDEKQMLGVASQPPPRPRIKKFNCLSCGNPVNVPSPDIMEIACPKCQAEYNLDPDAPAAPAPPQSVSPELEPA